MTTENLPTPPASVKGTQTETNLAAAYIAESTAYTRYMFYAKQARKENLFPIEHIFIETANNEMQHAKTFFKYLEGGKVSLPITIDAGVIDTTDKNLVIAISEEHTEGVEMYTKFAATARLEGFEHIAKQFEAIAKVEAMHKKRFECWLKHLQNGTMWRRDEPIKWICLVCGYIYEGTEPPAKCPGCNHPREHFMPAPPCAKRK
jgi:rubrerythrin